MKRRFLILSCVAVVAASTLSGCVFPGRGGHDDEGGRRRGDERREPDDRDEHDRDGRR